MRTLLAMVLLMVFAVPMIAVAQDEPQIQEEINSITTDDPIIYYDLFDMQAGQTIYLYLESDDFDAYLALCDIDCEEIFAEDDDSAGNFNASLSFTLTADGDYSIAVTDCCSDTATGEFRLLIGLNAPGVLNGTTIDNGAEIAVLYDGSPDAALPTPLPSNTGTAQVQVITSSISSDTRFVYYDLFEMQANDVLYLNLSSDAFDPFLIVCDITCEEIFAEDDDSAGNLNSALQFVFPEDGDYTIAIADCCTDDAEGEFQLMIGLNAPDALTGTAADTGAQIAVVFSGDPTTIAAPNTLDPTDCSQLSVRPVLSGPMLTRETENFVIHYTQQGRDGATQNFVDDVQSILESVLQTQVIEFGWPLPPPDCGEGGDQRYDLYLMELISVGTLGFAQPEGIVVDNPNSEAVERWAAYSYLAIDNNFAGVPNPRDVMRATIAHEFHHAIQFGYDINDELIWFYEATSTWMETQTFPEEEDASPYVGDLFNTPDLCIGSTPNELEYSSRIYAEWLFVDSLVRDYGDSILADLWQNIADVEGMPALYDLLTTYQTTPQDAIQRFAIRNLLFDYDFSERFPTRVRVEANVNGTGEVLPRQDGVQELGADYVRIAQQSVYNFSINQPNLNLLVVGIDQPNDEAFVFELGAGGTVDTTPYTHAYVIILNTDQHVSPDNCTTTEWILSVSEGVGTPLPPTGKVFDAQNFVPAG